MKLTNYNKRWKKDEHEIKCLTSSQNVQAAILEIYEMQGNNVPENSRTRKTASSKLFPLFASTSTKLKPYVKYHYEASFSYQGQQNPKNGNTW